MIVALLLAAAVATAPARLSQQAQEIIAPVRHAIETTRAELAALPPPKNDAEKLARMRKLEQAPRAALGTIDFSKIPPAERDAAMTAIWAEVGPIDSANQQALLAMLPQEGWFTISRYGQEGSTAAFLIVQHAHVELWRRFVPVLERLAARGEVRGGEYALMFDRLATTEGRQQRYGSQMRCVDAKYVPFPTEEPGQLDARRASVGLGPYADYLAMFADRPPC